jgi:hypothetical protein
MKVEVKQCGQVGRGQVGKLEDLGKDGAGVGSEREEGTFLHERALNQVSILLQCTRFVELRREFIG